MTKETMNVHRALIELKMLDKRISGLISDCESDFCVANKASNKKINGMNIEDYKNETKSKYQKITDQIARRAAIKQAIVKSNAVTDVEVADKKYTIAEAIELKNHGLDHKKALCGAMEECYSLATEECNQANYSLEDKARKYIVSMYGESEKASGDHEKEIRSFIESNTTSIVDPLGIKGIIDDLNTEIDSFMAEVDAALSTSNAMTMIEIEY